MLDRIVSGGQTRADLAALRAARSVGISTGGWAPHGWTTEDGLAPWLAGYGLVKLATGGYPERTRANGRDSTATVWFGDPDSPGGRTTMRACADLGRKVFLVIDGMTRPSDMAAWIEGEEIRVLNVAGNRESSSRGIGTRVERFMVAVLRSLAR